MAFIGQQFLPSWGIEHVRAAAALSLGRTDSAAPARVMRWDLVNPWARLCQLRSTHPLTALRVRELNRDAAELHQEPKYQLLEHERVSWTRFPIQVVLWAAPLVTGGLTGRPRFQRGVSGARP